MSAGTDYVIVDPPCDVFGTILKTRTELSRHEAELRFEQGGIEPCPECSSQSTVIFHEGRAS